MKLDMSEEIFSTHVLPRFFTIFFGRAFVDFMTIFSFIAIMKLFIPLFVSISEEVYGDIDLISALPPFVAFFLLFRFALRCYIDAYVYPALLSRGFLPGGFGACVLTFFIFSAHASLYIAASSVVRSYNYFDETVYCSYLDAFVAFYYLFLIFLFIVVAAYHIG
jgi:hypothetical protein